MTLVRWNVALAPAVPWQDAYNAVEQVARAHLLHNPVFDRDGITTDELVEALYPEQHARGDGITARKRIYKALAALATRGLSDCASRGPARKMKHTKKVIRPWLWHVPGEPNEETKGGVKTCPHCGGELT